MSVGSTDCNYYRMMGLNWLGDEYKAGNFTKLQIQDILMSCFGYTNLDAVADWMAQYDRDPEPEPEPEPEPPEDDPEEGGGICDLEWARVYAPFGSTQYEQLVLDYDEGRLSRTRAQSILFSCFQIDMVEVQDILNGQTGGDQGGDQGGNQGGVPTVINDPLLIFLGAIVLGMVFYYTLNTTKEAL